ncbi:MAG: hypothetical protein ACQESR_26310 [Planctomycetota bacterium]
MGKNRFPPDQLPHGAQGVGEGGLRLGVPGALEDSRVMATQVVLSDEGHQCEQAQKPGLHPQDGGGLPGWTLEFTTAGPSDDSESMQMSYLKIQDGRYGDNFIAVAHPHTGIADDFGRGKGEWDIFAGR